MINSPNKITALLAIILLLPLTAGVCIADSDSGSQSSTTYRFGAIFSGVENIVHWNGSCSYSPNPNVADEMDIAVNTSIGQTSFTITSFNYATHTYEFYAYPNSSDTTVTIIMTGLTPNKPWDLMRGSTHIYDGTIFTNNTGGISFTFTMNAENASFKLSQYGADSGSPSGPGGGSGSSGSSTTATTTTVNNTTVAPGTAWAPPTDSTVVGIEELSPIIVVGILVSIILIMTSASENGNVRGTGYAISLIAGGAILLLIYGSTTIFNLFTIHIMEIIIILAFIFVVMVLAWLIMATSKPRKHSEPEDTKEI